MVENECLDGSMQEDATPLLTHWSSVAANRNQQQMEVGIQKHTIEMG